MNVGIIGLGRMGEAIAYRLIEAGHTIFGFDKNKEACDAAKKTGVVIVNSFEEFAKETHIFWLMVPAGDIINAVIKELHPYLGAGDIIIDGGNSKYTDSMQRAKMLDQHNVFFLDCGTSGGIRGRAEGFCLMVGGNKDVYTKVHELFEAIAIEGGVAHVGPSGTGHYVKMIHNGIEYALLQAYAEGYHLIKEGTFKDVLNLEEISRIWNQGAIIKSFINELAHDIFSKDEDLRNISGEIAETGMGKWTVEESHQHNISVRVIKQALKIRGWSRKTGGDYGTKIVAMLRHKFGGHSVKKIKE